MGFVELKRQNSFDAATINALLFQDMGLNPLMPTPLPVDWLLTGTTAEARDRIKNLLADARFTDQCYYMSDPLFCHTLPLWLEVFKEKSLAVTCIHILRHPWEVAQSLEGFENLDFFKAHTLWLSFSLTLLKQSQCPTLVTFDQLLADPVSTLKRLINTDTFQENKSDRADLELLDLVQPALKHNHAASFNEAAQKTFRPFEHFYQQLRINYLKTTKQVKLFQEVVTESVFSDIMPIFLNAYGRQEKQPFNKLMGQGQNSANQSDTDLYARVKFPDFQENISSNTRLPLFIDEWQKIAFPLSELVLSSEKSFVFSPLNSNGVVKISNINLLNKINGESVWAAKTIEDFNRLSIRGNAVRLPDKENLILLITGPEPEIHLPLLTHISSCPVDLEVWLKVTKKQDIVRDKVSLSLLANDQMRRDEGAGPFLKLPKGLSVPDDEEAVVDYILENSSKFLPADKFPIFLALARHHIKQKNNLRALHYLGQARNSIPERPENLLSLANLYLDINRIEEALELYVALFLKEWFVDETLGNKLIQQFNLMYKKVRKSSEHGQQILMDYIRGNIEYLKSKADHKLTLIEIGSTREDVPGQGSTRKLADFCKTHGLHFITVDMDPQNTKMAAETLSKIDAEFKAVNQKGEDFLREYAGPMDFVFLDAYDFDHGKHSTERQIRYEKYLGNRISDQACPPDASGMCRAGAKKNVCLWCCLSG
jgi:hypothetical protein